MTRFAISACLLLSCLPSLSRARPGQVVRTLAAPSKNATGMAYDGKLLWLADHRLDRLIAIDPGSGVVQKTLPTPGYRPAGLAFDGEGLWCVDVHDQAAYRLRPSDGRVLRTVPVYANTPWGISPRALAFDGKALWVSDDARSVLQRADPEDGTVLREIPFPAKSVDGLAFDGRYLWVADRLTDKLYALEPEAGEVVVTLAAPGPHPSGLAWDGKNLLLVDYQTDTIYVLLRDDNDPIESSAAVERWVVFSHQVRNFGPDAVVDLESLLSLPGDTTSQTLLAPPAFSPAGPEMASDQFGQKAARFRVALLPAGQTAESRIKVRVRTRDVRYHIYPEKVSSAWNIPPELRRLYLADSSKLDIANPVIVKAVAEAVGKEKNPYWIARRIYRYIHQRMHYERVGGWDTAPQVLARGSGSCSEYTFVFMAMCRTAGIPARYAGSVVMRQDEASYDDVFHRWVEIWLPPYGWIPVDPSRGDKASEAERADAFGHLTNDFLITTLGGGGSTLLDWNYNANERFQCQGRCRVEVEALADWSPEDPDLPPAPSAPPPSTPPSP
ncbi:MAG: transglutaminase [Myxococcales bacterium]|nr:transglutaminase [Myxococcales bacterium]